MTFNQPSRWDGVSDRGSNWAKGLDDAAIRPIAKQYLSPELPNPLNENFLVVSLFAHGAFDELYLISYTGHHTEYLVRVSVPVEPYLKTESEVATLASLRTRTTIPVPRVVAWDSNCDNELGCEWLLMERIKGVTLYNVWRTMSWPAKQTLTAEVAGMIKHLRDLEYECIGSLYFESALIEKSGKPTMRRCGEESSLSKVKEQYDVFESENSTSWFTSSLFELSRLTIQQIARRTKLRLWQHQTRPRPAKKKRFMRKRLQLSHQTDGLNTPNALISVM